MTGSPLSPTAGTKSHGRDSVGPSRLSQKKLLTRFETDGGPFLRAMETASDREASKRDAVTWTFAYLLPPKLPLEALARRYDDLVVEDERKDGE